MNNNVINVYLKKDKVYLFLILNLIFTFVLFSVFEDIIENKNLFEKILLVSGIALLVSGNILFTSYLLRKKTMLTIDDEKIIIYKSFGNPIVVYLSNIKSVNIWKMYFKGFVSSRQVVLELKKTTEKAANSQYGIVTNFLDKNDTEIKKIIDKKIKKVRQSR